MKISNVTSLTNVYTLITVHIYVHAITYFFPFIRTIISLWIYHSINQFYVSCMGHMYCIFYVYIQYTHWTSYCFWLLMWSKPLDCSWVGLPRGSVGLEITCTLAHSDPGRHMTRTLAHSDSERHMRVVWHTLAQGVTWRAFWHTQTQGVTCSDSGTLWHRASHKAHSDTLGPRALYKIANTDYSLWYGEVNMYIYIYIHLQKPWTSDGSKKHEATKTWTTLIIKYTFLLLYYTQICQIEHVKHNRNYQYKI